jgi:hypothetical protein
MLTLIVFISAFSVLFFAVKLSRLNIVILLIIDFLRRLVAKRTNVTLSNNHKYAIIRNTFNSINEEIFYIPYNTNFSRFNIRVVGLSQEKETPLPIVRYFNGHFGLDVTPAIVGYDILMVSLYDRTTNKHILTFNILTPDTSIAEAIEQLLLQYPNGKNTLENKINTIIGREEVEVDSDLQE